MSSRHAARVLWRTLKRYRRVIEKAFMSAVEESRRLAIDKATREKELEEAEGVSRTEALT